MRRIFRRLVFYPLLLAFAAAGAGWLLHAPHRPERLFRAVPAHAEFVSLHRRLSARWESVVDNPGVARTASVLAGMEIAAWRRSPRSSPPLSTSARAARWSGRTA